MVGVVIAFIAGAVIGATYALSEDSLRDTGIDAVNRKRREIKEESKRLVLELAQREGAITNESVVRLLHVSDSTATNYLRELVSEGRLERIGRRGGYVKYRYLDLPTVTRE